MITYEQLQTLGFEQDGYSTDIFVLYQNDVAIELCGHQSIGNTTIPEGTFMLTADLGYIHLSRPFKDISEIEALIEALI